MLIPRNISINYFEHEFFVQRDYEFEQIFTSFVQLFKYFIQIFL